MTNYVLPLLAAVIFVSPTIKEAPQTGIASYYSRAGCVGCSADLTMANGEKLDDTKLTVAYNHGKLNQFVDVSNMINGKTIRAKVTDRGGFEKLGRIVDLNVATKDAIGCSSLCKVKVKLIY